MTGITKVGLNISALANIEPPNITISTNAQDLLRELPANAVALSGGYYPHTIMIAIFVFFYWILVEKSAFAKFKYSYMRGSVIAFGLTSAMGVSLVSVGYIVAFKVVAMFVSGFILSIILTLALENKQ